MKNQDTPTAPQMFHNAPAKSFQYAYRSREAPTPAEEKLWNALKGKQLGGYKFRRQHPVSHYILDFYCHAAKLAIEVDGGYHLSEEQKQYDTRRTADLLDLGVREIRFTNDQIIHNLEKVLEDIFATISNPLADKHLP
jgi:very-short-patch-repair endonuclease